MHALPLLALVGCGVFGLERMGADDSAGVDTGPLQGEDQPVTTPLLGRTWESDLATAAFRAPQGLAGFVALLDSSLLLVHVLAESADQLDLLIALTAADGDQDPCQPVLELPDADWTGNPVLDLARDELVLTVNGMPVNLQDLRLSMRIQQWGQGFEDGAVQATIDGRELDAALGDRVDSTTCELLDAMGTACRACADGVEACFDVDLASLTGADYSGTFDEEPDPSSCD